MIPKEKIEQAAINYKLHDRPLIINAFKAGVLFAETELSKPTLSPDTRQNLFNYFEQEHGIQLMDSDFHEIQNYVKPELKGITLEFAEWPRKNGYTPYTIDSVIYYSHPIFGNRFLTSELFDKLMAERQV